MKRPGDFQVFFCTGYNYCHREFCKKMENDFIPSAMIKKAAAKWWVIAGLMILGGLVGMVVTRIHKPVYQSQALITTSIDYAYIGSLEDYELDHLILSVGDVIDSSEVRQAVVDQAQKGNPGIAPEKILADLTAIRKGYDWILSARASDPAAAQKIAQWWADAAMKALLEMKKESLDSFHLQTILFAVEECFSQSVITDPVSSGCSAKDLAQLHTFIKPTEQSTNSVEYRQATIISNLSFALTKTPEIPASAILFKQNLNVLAGAFIGLLLGMAWFFWGKV